MDGIDGERFQAHAVLLAVCKVKVSLLDIQWHSRLFEILVQEGESEPLDAFCLSMDYEHTKLNAEERLIR